MSILSELRQFIHRHGLIPAGASVVVGVSGGPDSLALLHALARLAPEHGWHLHAAYLHHGLRPEAEAEALFVAEAASAWGLGCTLARADVAAIAAQPGVSLEEAARQTRYAFLARTAIHLGAGIIAVGHTADDQAETVLMHLLRGSGLAGLRGMLPATPFAALRLPALPPAQRCAGEDLRLVRPWLATERSAILAYCQAQGLQPRFDASNADTTLFRNHLRHTVLPLLRQSNPRLTATLGRTAAALAGDYEILRQRRRRLWADLAESGPGWARLRLAAFRSLPLGDQRALLRRAILHLRPDLRDLNWAHTEALLDLLAADPTCRSGGPYPLVAGLSARLLYEWLEIAAAPPPLTHPQIAAALPLPLPGAADLGGGWRLVARGVAWPRPAPVADPQRLWLPLDVAQPLHLRPRQPGDRMQPFGLAGSKAITDLMTELKLPRPARAAWPLLVDAADCILWLVGCRAAEACRLPAQATAAWALHVQRVEEGVE